MTLRLQSSIQLLFKQIIILINQLYVHLVVSQRNNRSIYMYMYKLKLKISSNRSKNKNYFKTETVVETEIISKLKLELK